MRSELTRALRNKWLYFSALIAFLVLLRPALELFPERAEGIDALMFYSFPMNFGGLQPFAILFCIAPYACSFFDEGQNGFLRYALLHASRRRYIVGKMVAIFVAGALALMIPFGAMALLAHGLFAPVTPASLEQGGYFGGSFWRQLTLSLGGGGVLTLKVLLSGLYGGIWALPGLICSCLSSHRLSAFVIPFSANYAAWVLLRDNHFSPTFFLTADRSSFPSLGFVLGVQAVYLCAFALASYGLMKWRCDHG